MNHNKPQSSAGTMCHRVILLFFFLASVCAAAQPTENTDESKVGAYTLPPLLQTGEGKQIKTAKEWETLQRPRILQLFTDNVYGRFPGRPADMHFETASLDANALNGKATRKEVIIYFTKGNSGPALNVLLYLPNRATGKVPVFVGLNFEGNHTIQKDAGITITESWKALHPQVANITRGDQDRRWPVEELIEAGYGVATAWYQDLEVDNPEGWKSGIRTTLQQSLNIRPGEWGAVAAWGWGLSRIMDYLETDSKVNAKQVVLTGHSRLGKAALWAGANDKRFAIIVSNNSGEGGAALARRNFGETVYRINTSFPYWFIDKYKTYNNAVDQLPVDQHELLALMAPRPLYVASASEDLWADPKGEFLGAKEAGKVYELYGKKGLVQNEPPLPETPVGNWVMYHLRTGKHDMLLYDWQQYRLFADKVFNRMAP
jgi:hypothetical protein